MLTLEILRKLWPHGNEKIPGLVEGIAESAPDVLPKYGVTTPLLLAHLLAQMSHECGAGHDVVENISYTSPARIAAVWPSRFNSVTAVPYARNPRALANKVYNGRMGNRVGSDDGYNFRGRGGTQVTGREGYSKLGEKVGLDLVNNPDLVNDPRHFLECAVADWILCGCLPFAARDDIRGETHHLNGGYIGLDQRTAWLRKCKTALAVEHGADSVAGPARVPDALQYGDRGWQVRAMQGRLNGLGYKVGKADGDFGAATRAQVFAFQADRGLPTTGIVDAATKAALASNLSKPVDESRATATLDDMRDAGSTTVDRADTASGVGKFKVMLGALGLGGGGAQQLGLLDSAQGAVDKAQQAKSIWTSAIDLASPLVLAISAAVFVGGIIVWLAANRIKQSRLKAHRLGRDMSR